MAKKLGILVIIWLLTIVAYIGLAAMFPVIQTVTSNVSANISSYSASTYPGARAFIDSAPLWMWFIPGLISVVVSVIVLKSK